MGATSTDQDRSTPADSAESHRGGATRFLCLLAALFLYLFSTGPVAWATNDGLHPRYLPEDAMCIYMPLLPLMQIDCIRQAHYWWTVVIWHGFPYGYTTV